jgi:hypothetical protein
VGEWVRFRLRTLLAAISLKEPVFTGVLHCLAAPANLDGVLKELEKARSNQLEMMHALGFVMLTDRMRATRSESPQGV